MKAFKKIVEVILKLTAATAFAMMFAESSNGSCDILWTLSWMAVLTISAVILGRMGALKKLFN